VGYDKPRNLAERLLEFASRTGPFQSSPNKVVGVWRLRMNWLIRYTSGNPINASTRSIRVALLVDGQTPTAGE